MKMKKFVAAAVAGCLAVSLAACGSNGGNGGSEFDGNNPSVRYEGGFGNVPGQYDVQLGSGEMIVPAGGQNGAPSGNYAGLYFYWRRRNAADERKSMDP